MSKVSNYPKMSTDEVEERREHARMAFLSACGGMEELAKLKEGVAGTVWSGIQRAFNSALRSHIQKYSGECSDKVLRQDVILASSVYGCRKLIGAKVFGAEHVSKIPPIYAERPLDPGDFNGGDPKDPANYSMEYRMRQVEVAVSMHVFSGAKKHHYCNINQVFNKAITLIRGAAYWPHHKEYDHGNNPSD